MIRAEDTRTPVLIAARAEREELVARAIHFRARLPIAVCCSGLRVAGSNLIESELFGYEKGAFTGAVALRPGFFSRRTVGRFSGRNWRAPAGDAGQIAAGLAGEGGSSGGQQSES